jgi:hypothetical protein
LPKAKAVAVPVQYLEYRTAPIAEDKKMAGKGIKTQGIFHQNGKSVDGLSHIRASGGQKHAHMGRLVNHIRLNTRTTCSKVSGSNPFSISTRKCRSTTTQSCGEGRNRENGVTDGVKV